MPMTVAELNEALQPALELMGFASVKPSQTETLSAVLADKPDSDVLALLPTGGGKSALFILPTIAKDWQCLVISPLIALQNDQVDKLLDRGIAAAAINSGKTSSYTERARAAWLTGGLQFLYLSPESLQSNAVRNLLSARRPDLIVVDEVHTADAWGNDFRPAFTRIAAAVDELRPVRLLCLTATLTPAAEASVRDMLKLRNVRRTADFSPRENLSFQTLRNVEMDQLCGLLGNRTGSTIVYSATVRCITEELYPVFSARFGEENVAVYHGQMEDGREEAQELFMSGKKRFVIATNAFGMGVDKPDIRAVAHWQVPGTLEAYAQEAGRAGRDGLPSSCILCCNKESVRIQEYFIGQANPARHQYESLWRSLRSWALAGGRQDDEEADDRAVTGRTLTLSVGEMSYRLSGQANLPWVGAAISQLTALGWLRRSGGGKPSFTAKVRNANGLLPDDDLKTVRLFESIMDGGGRPVPFVDAQHRLKLKGPDLKSRLAELSRRGVIELSQTGRAATTTILKEELDDLDWNVIEKRRQRELEDFATMIRFANTPDEDKHAALKEYLTTGVLT